MIHGKLLPVIPRATEGEDQTGRPTKIKAIRYLLERYGEHLTDTVICFEEKPEVVEAILGMGKKVVPTIISDRDEFVHNEGVLRWKSDPRSWWRKWVEWVLSNEDRFEAVQLGNFVVEVSNGANNAEDLSLCELTEDIIRRIMDAFPGLVGRLALAPMIYDLYPDAQTVDKPVRKALLEAGPWFVVYWGYEFLEKHTEAMRGWLRGTVAYSGVNYSEGAADHNLAKLLDLGFAGGLFFLPVHSERSQADRRMEQYLTDVR